MHQKHRWTVAKRQLAAIFPLFVVRITDTSSKFGAWLIFTNQSAVADWSSLSVQPKGNHRRILEDAPVSNGGQWSGVSFQRNRACLHIAVRKHFFCDVGDKVIDGCLLFCIGRWSTSIHADSMVSKQKRKHRPRCASVGGEHGKLFLSRFLIVMHLLH